MPLTFPAHQAFVLPIKLLWPRRVDATALCIGAAAPDLGYWMGSESHGLLGVLAFAIPFTLVACALLRWRAALGVFGNLPDFGPFRLHSYRVLVARRPGAFVTAVSATIGVASHVLVDAFTHKGRWGANWLGLNEAILAVPRYGEISIAQALQIFGHTVGSIVGALLFLHIGRARLLERWYGTDNVAAARTFQMSTAERLVFWTAAGAIVAMFMVVGIVSGARPVFTLILGASVGLIAAGCSPPSRTSA